ncbi:MAG: hypothetical protein QN597_10575 [Nitrososphaeraceae archaeon]|nr:hypothetical protein [Nitrososphaeraceae archaeon]
MKGNYYVVKSAIITSLIVAMIFTNVSLNAKVSAESGVGKDVFKVVVSLFGITNSTKDIVTLVNVKDQTKIKMFNAENPETEGEDKVSYVITFQNLSVDDGEPYNVCTVSVADFKLDCKDGNNSPLNRPEFVDINVSEFGSGEEEQQ